MAYVTKKICDRCKKEITERRGVAVFEPIFIRSILGLELIRKGMYYPDRFYKKTLDLCEECSNKLVWFIEGAELYMGESEREEEDSVSTEET